MKRVITAFLGAFCTIFTLNAQTTTNGTGGGLWSNPSTWIGGVVPTSGSIVISSGDSLQVDGNYTVDDITFNYRNVSRCTLRVASGNTLSCEIIYTVPTQSNGTANIIANGNLFVNNGAANRDIRITGSNVYFNLTNNVIVPSGGQLVITDQFKHNSLTGSDQNDLNITTVGKFQCKAFSAQFDDDNSNFNLNINGDFDYTNMTVLVIDNTSKIDVVLGSSADVDASQFTYLEARSSNCLITNTVNSGSDWRMNGYYYCANTPASSDSRIDLDISAPLRCAGFNFSENGSNDSIALHVRNGGSIISSQHFRNLVTVGSGLHYVIDVDNGGSISASSFFNLQTNDDSEVDVDIDGTVSFGTNFSGIFRDGTRSTIDIGATGSFTGASYTYDFRNNGRFVLTNNGTHTATSTYYAAAGVNDTVDFIYNSPTTISGEYRQENDGSGSVIRSEVFSTLTLGNLRYDVLTTALGSNNIMDIDNPNAVLNLNALRFIGTSNGTLISGSSNNSTVVFKGSTAGDSIPVKSSLEYDNITVSNTSGIALMGPLTSSNFHGNMTINAGGSLTLTGSTSGRVTVQDNFTNAGTFQNNAGTDFTVIGNYSNTGTHGHTSGNFYFGGDFANSGTFQAETGDTAIFNGSSTQSITGTTTFNDIVAENDVIITSGTTSLQNSLEVTGSSNFNGNGNMVLLSNATGTAYLKELTNGNSVSGNFTVQRFLNEGVGYYMLGSPVTGSTLADWNNELQMSGFTGSNFPSSGVSVYNYLESGRNGTNISSGYRAATNTTNSINPSEGWFVYLWNAPQTVNSVGPLFTGSTTIGTGTLTFSNIGPTANRGFHLRANPYASPILWADVNKSNIESNEAYVRRADDGGNYWAVNADNIDIIYSHEAFWTRAASAAGATLTFDEADKTDAADDYNARKLAPLTFENPLKMELTYSGNANYMDYAVLRFGDASNSVDFDGTYGEARKLASSVGTVPNIASFAAGDTSEVYYNSLNPDVNSSIPVKVWTRYPSSVANDYTVNFNGIEEWVKNNHCLILRDNVTNYTRKLDQNFNSYTWNMIDTVKAPRLTLEHSLPLTYSSENATCFGYSDGIAEVLGFGSGNHSYTWFDENNNIVKRDIDISGPSSMNSLSAGTYTIYVSDNGACGEMAATIVIEEPEPIIADFSTDVDTVYMNANSTIYFTNSSVNADSYEWNFGDGTTSSLESPSHTYTSGGEFNVTMVAIDGACSDTLKKVVVVIDNVGITDISTGTKEPISIYQLNNETFVELNFEEASNATISMFDVMGRNIINPIDLRNVKSRKVQLDIPDNLLGVYTVNVITSDDRVSKKLYFARK